MLVGLLFPNTHCAVCGVALCLLTHRTFPGRSSQARRRDSRLRDGGRIPPTHRQPNSFWSRRKGALLLSLPFPTHRSVGKRSRVHTALPAFMTVHTHPGQPGQVPLAPVYALEVAEIRAGYHSGRAWPTGGGMDGGRDQTIAIARSREERGAWCWGCQSPGAHAEAAYHEDTPSRSSGVA